MAKQQVAPVHVRLDADTLQRLRELAERNSGTVHGEVVRAVEQYVAREFQPPETAQLRQLAEGVIDQFTWTAAGDDEADKLASSLILAAIKAAFERAGANPTPSKEVQALGDRAAQAVWQVLSTKRGGKTP